MRPRVRIVPCLEGGTPTGTSGSSIYPAVQNMLLAARALGLGATLTTLYLQFEKEAEAALGLPSNVHSYALLPIGYPIGRFGPVRRVPLAEVVYENRWGQPYSVRALLGINARLSAAIGAADYGRKPPLPSRHCVRRMMTDDPAWALAQHVCRTRYPDLPATAIESTRRDILDTFGCMLGGSGSPGIDELFAVVCRWGGLAESHVLL